MGQLLRSTVPTTRDQRQPHLINPTSMRRKYEQNTERQRKNFDNRRCARELPQLQLGDPVWLPNKEAEGTIGEEVAPQSFNVLSRDGSERGYVVLGIMYVGYHNRCVIMHCIRSHAYGHCHHKYSQMYIVKHLVLQLVYSVCEYT